MFVGFNLSLREDAIDDKYYLEGKKLYSVFENKSRKVLDELFSPNGSLDASKIEENWFYQIDADVFISHSHNDENSVIKFAGFLYKEYGIKSFIDSCVWGYVNDLLKSIDDKFCKTIKNKDGTYSYNYDTRNRSTSHVHMILNGALAKMINNAECLIFVNTPNSIKVEDITNESKTSSPWIYSELLIATVFPHQELSYHRGIQHQQPIFAESANNFDVIFDAPLNKLIPLNLNDIKNIDKKNKGIKMLTKLYINKGMIKKKEIL